LVVIIAVKGNRGGAVRMYPRDKPPIRRGSKEERVSENARPVAVGPGEGTTIQGPAGGPLTFKVRGEQTNGTLTVVENIIAPGDGPPVHVHANEDESWYVLSGDVRFLLGKEIRLAPTGSFVYVPRGVPHGFQNVGQEPARILVMFTPAGMERFFDRLAALPQGSVARDAFVSAGREVDMEVVGPPLATSHPQ
jgi:quercetin dioxygenase-like cupin family protein